VGSTYGGRQEDPYGWALRFVLAAALTAALIAVLFASGGLQTLDEAFGKRGDKAASAQYQYRPGWGCGDRNHIHTGPPGRQYSPPPPGCLK
jgi:hypothetical protein